MHGRVTTIQGAPEREKEAREMITGTVIPTAREIPGLKAGYWLTNGEGKVVAVTLFETEEEMVASRDTAQRLREGGTSKLGATVVSVEEFEVVGQI